MESEIDSLAEYARCGRNSHPSFMIISASHLLHDDKRCQATKWFWSISLQRKRSFLFQSVPQTSQSFTVVLLSNSLPSFQQYLVLNLIKHEDFSCFLISNRFSWGWNEDHHPGFSHNFHFRSTWYIHFSSPSTKITFLFHIKHEKTDKM